jgi:hypothetical protein
MEKKDMDTVYSYFKVTTKIGTGFVCLRIARPPKEVTKNCKYTITYSFCSPTDSFSRIVARRICDSRASSDRVKQKVVISYKDKPSYTKVITDAFERLSKNPETSGLDIGVPQWLSGAKSIQPYRELKKSTK